MTERVLAAFRDLIVADQDTLLITRGGVIAAIMAHLFPEEKNRYEWQPAPREGYVVDLSGQTYDSLQKPLSITPGKKKPDTVFAL